jgi:hypothetical protein
MKIESGQAGQASLYLRPATAMAAFSKVQRRGGREKNACAIEHLSLSSLLRFGVTPVRGNAITNRFGAAGA